MTIRQLSNDLFALMHIEPIPEVEYVLRPRMPDVTALTKQEIEWLEQAEKEDVK